jgi:predicted transcriptional regulator
MKATLSVPDELFDAAEALRKRLRISRSRLYSTALAEFVAKHQSRKVTSRLDSVYAAEESGLDPRLRRLQAKSLPRESW